MIRIQQIKVPLNHTEIDIQKKILKLLRISPEALVHFKIVKQSIDARKKEDVCYVYTIDAHVKKEERLMKQMKNPNISFVKEKKYSFPIAGTQQYKNRPVVVGSGPAGLFCAYELATHGYAPLVLERGCDIDKRTADVETFWNGGMLIPNSNVQFGEGGAGTFSDGKLNTLVKDVCGRNKKILELFVEAGAPEDILYVNKPHIGTDILKNVVKNMREIIIHMGGEFCFESQLTNIEILHNKIYAIEINHIKRIETDIMVLAIGHSARDTFTMLNNTMLHMEAKAFAIGMRVEHPQQMMNENQYKGADMTYLPTASYKLTSTLENGRGVYSFCMCPGGYVVNASSEENHLAVNGMSYHARDGKNANSAVVVSVTPTDFANNDALAGVAFQQQLEKKAYALGTGAIPQQQFGDFEKNQVSESYGAFESCTKGQTTFANLREIFPTDIAESFIQGMHRFSRYIPNFDREDAILSGIESRTSSPLRIIRDDFLESNIGGIYPCGEGAGYAGGIMSAAMDGIKVAEAIASKYSCNKTN